MKNRNFWKIEVPGNCYIAGFCTKYARASGAIAPCEAKCATGNGSQWTLLWKFLPRGLPLCHSFCHLVVNYLFISPHLVKVFRVTSTKTVTFTSIVGEGTSHYQLWFQLEESFKLFNYLGTLRLYTFPEVPV